MIIAAFALGLTVDNFPKAYTGAIINLHALLGVAILVLTLVRLGWRLSHRPPELDAASGRIIRLASKAVHGLLYALMVLVPLIGFPTLFYRGRGLDFGLLQIAPFLPRTPEIFRPLTDVHEIAAFALIGLAIAHPGRALPPVCPEGCAAFPHDLGAPIARMAQSKTARHRCRAVLLVR